MLPSSDFNILAHLSPIDHFDLYIQVSGSRPWRNRYIGIFFVVAIEAGISEGDIQAIYIVAFNVVVIISSVQTVPVDYGGEYFCFRLIRVRFKQSCSDLYFCRGLRAIDFHHVVHIRCVVYRRTVGDIAVQCCRIAVAEVSGCHHHSPIITAEKT